VRARRLAAAFAAALLACGTPAHAALPRAIAQAFQDAGVRIDHVAIVVQDLDRGRPLLTHRAERPMNAASVMKLVTTFAALDLLGPDYRWHTEAYLDGALEGGVLHGNLVLRGRGDPKITVEQWQALMAQLRARGLDAVDGDLVLDRSAFALPAYDPAAFDHAPLKAYNVGPDALLVNFKAARLRFYPEAAGVARVEVDPPLPAVRVAAPPPLDAAPCTDWRRSVGARIADDGAHAEVTFAGAYPAACGEREWWVALLDAPHYTHAMFTAFFAQAGGRFAGGVAEGAAPAGAAPFAVLDSPPLAEVVRDINKLSNNVMARQLFLTLALEGAAPPATTQKAIGVVQRVLAQRQVAMPGLAMDNGAGLSRRARVTAGGLVRLLRAADRSTFRDAFADSLAVAAVDGTAQNRFRDIPPGEALLKTGTLDGVRAIAGYVHGGGGRRYAIAAMVNDRNAAQAASALEYLVQWVDTEGAAPQRCATSPARGGCP
jgi:D-alanyl-D-alanine carboxypeptidase/D-alanyl-D-alanine-endopeptidase (penicillin-binding protein 4)